MRNKYTFILLLWTVMVSYAQDYSALWEGHFSYLNVNDIVQGNGKIFAASENAVFVYNIASEELETMERKTFFLFLFIFIIISLTGSVIADSHLPIGILKSIEHNKSLAQDVLQNVSFFLAFLAGMTSLVSPCILPLLPAYFAITFIQDDCWRSRDYVV